MGCTQSKIENEETVIRCKDQKQFMRHRTTQISGRGFTIGDVEDDGLAPPRSNRTTPPPPEAKGIASWEFFPSMENVPGPTLAELEENVVERLCLRPPISIHHQHCASAFVSNQVEPFEFGEVYRW
ncbi:hypothetical protein LguiA_035252 [Lonicera macranthoides]